MYVQTDCEVQKDDTTCVEAKKSRGKYVTRTGTVSNIVNTSCGFIKSDTSSNNNVYVFSETKDLHKDDKVKFKTLSKSDETQHFQKALNVRRIQ